MRKILGLVLIIVSINSFGQNPSNYQYRVVYERLRGLMPDSVFHLPRYNGVPSGLRGGSAYHDGALASDTLNGNVYHYWNTTWKRLAYYTDLATGSRFGVEDSRATQTRSFSGAGTHPFTFDSLSQLNINFDPGNGLIFTDYVNGIDRLRINTVAGSRLFSPNGSNEVSVNDGRAMLLVGTNDSILLSSVSGKVYIPNIPYNSGAGIVHLGLDTVASSPTFNKLVRKTAGSGSTPGIDDVLAIGQQLTTNRTIDVNNNTLLITGINDPSAGFNVTGNSTTSLSNITNSGTGAGLIGTAASSVSGGLHGKNNSYFGVIGENTNGGGGVFALSTGSTTNTVLTALRLGGRSSGTTAANFGVMMDMQLQRDNGSHVSSNQIISYWETPASGSEIARLKIKGVRNAALEDFMDIKYDGVVRVNNNLDTLATKAYARSVGGGGGGGSGTVTDVSVVTANGISGSVATSTTTPAITLNINQDFEPWYNETLDMTSSVYGAFYWVSSGTGSGISGFTTSAVPLGWTSGHNLATGTTTTGLACHYKQAGGTYAAIALSSAKRHNINGRFIIPILSDGTETFECYGGFMDDITGSANIVDGVYWSYTHSVSSGQLVFNCENNNTKSTSVGASPITIVAGTEYNWDITVIGGVAYLYINGTFITSINTNIPDDDTNRITCAGDVIIKIAGTTSRSMYVGRLQYGERKN